MKNELLETLSNLFIRDLNKLESELSQYPNEESIWKIDKSIANSGGNLVLHLCGNLQHFIGTVLGKTGYVRNRDNEFAAKNIPRKDLLTEIDNTRKAMSATLANLTDEQLKANYPIEVFGKPMTTTYFLVHLSGHLGYHLGQVNYHRRLLA